MIIIEIPRTIGIPATIRTFWEQLQNEISRTVMYSLVNFFRKEKSALLMAILLLALVEPRSVKSAESPNVKPLTAAQEAIWEEQEELYDKYSRSGPDQYPDLIGRLQSLLKKQEAAFGPDSAQVSCTLDQLWDLYKLQKQPVPQMAVMQRSMEIKRRILGPQAVDTALATCHLANSMAANKQYEAALSFLENYLKQLNVTETRSAEIMTVYEIAQTYSQWNKFKEAQPWFDKAVNMKANYAIKSRVYPVYRRAVAAQQANQQLLLKSGASKAR